MRMAMLGIMITALSVAAVEVAVHWYACTAGTPLAHRLASAYFYRDADNHKAYVAGVVNLVVPAIGLGVALGAFGAAWPPRRLAVGVVILSLGLIALFPLYAGFFENGSVRWWSPTGEEPATTGDYVVALLKAMALCGVFAYGARLVALRPRQ
jgi:hypothetical protein